MKKFIRHSIDGRILSINSCLDDDLIKQPGYPSEIMEIPFDLEIDLKSHFVCEGVVTKLPKCPSENYDFDLASRTWVPNTIKEWDYVRSKRQELLMSTDWTQLPDVPLETKTAWATYRQALRDVTEQPDPFNIVWPEKP